MIGNTWLDRETGEIAYGIEDGRYRLLTAGGDVDQQTEIDPTQRAARSDGCFVFDFRDGNVRAIC